MGLAPSKGKDNDELVDILVEQNSIKTLKVEHIMRIVDRGRFLPKKEKENAYRNSAWKSESAEPGFLHLSAPCIYANVLENLEIPPGASFLNIGSGTGYFSTMAGFLLGSEGINHGVELFENVIKYAEKCVKTLLQCDEVSVFDFCIPRFFLGNAFDFNTDNRYDRIYIGALVPFTHRSYFCNLLSVGGILIMPMGSALQRVERLSKTEFYTKSISSVTFSHLIPLNTQNLIFGRRVSIPLPHPDDLEGVCRFRIRDIVRNATKYECKLEMRSICEEKKKSRKRKNDDRNSRSHSNSSSSNHNNDNDASSNDIIAVDNNSSHSLRSRDSQNSIGVTDRDHLATNLHPIRHQLFALIQDRLGRHFDARARRAARFIGSLEVDLGGAGDGVAARNNTQQQERRLAGANSDGIVGQQQSPQTSQQQQDRSTSEGEPDRNRPQANRPNNDATANRPIRQFNFAEYIGFYDGDEEMDMDMGFKFISDRGQGHTSSNPETTQNPPHFLPTLDDDLHQEDDDESTVDVMEEDEDLDDDNDDGENSADESTDENPAQHRHENQLQSSSNTTATNSLDENSKKKNSSCLTSSKRKNFASFDDKEKDMDDDDSEDEGHVSGGKKGDGNESSSTPLTEQALYLNIFRKEFDRRIDSLPISQKMRSFLKYK